MRHLRRVAGMVCGFMGFVSLGYCQPASNQFLMDFSLMARVEPGNAVEIRHANIVDVRKGKLRKNRRVHLRNGKVIKVRREWFPRLRKPHAHTRQLDAKGMYLLPGLSNMHSHGGCYSRDRLLSLRFGITYLREFDPIPNLQQELEQSLFGHHISPNVACAYDLQAQIEELATADNPPKPAVLLSYLKKKKNAPSGDFLPLSPVTPFSDQQTEIALLKKSAMGIAWEPAWGTDFSQIHQYKSIQSIENLGGIVSGIREQERLPDAEIRELAKWKGYFSPNLTGVTSIQSFEQYYRAASVRGYELASQARLRDWERFYDLLDTNGLPNYARIAKNAELRISATQILRKAGAKFLIGTEYSPYKPGSIAGYDVHAEMKLFAKIGFSPKEVLTAAITNAWEYRGIPKRLLKIRRRTPVELILLKENPLKNISAIETISAIMIENTLIDTDALQYLDNYLRNR